MSKEKVIEYILKLSLFGIGLTIFYYLLFLNVYEGYGIVEIRGFERGISEAALLAIGIIASMFVMIGSYFIEVTHKDRKVKA